MQFFTFPKPPSLSGGQAAEAIPMRGHIDCCGADFVALSASIWRTEGASQPIAKIGAALLEARSAA
jgi:hypothetical protein